MGDTESKVLGCFGLVILIPFLLVYGYWADGYVLMRLWEWFIVPLFDLPTLTLLQAIGLGMVVSFITRHSVASSKKDKDGNTDWAATAAYVLTAMVAPWITLGVASIVHSLF